MKIGRLFFYDDYKGTRGYLKTQTKYEIFRTCLYFAISFSLFLAGLIATGNRMNLLTIVAVLGCLPACKSSIDAYMFSKHKGCTEENADLIDKHMKNMIGIYDRVFTSYERTYNVAHVVIKGNTVCGFTQEKSFDESKFRTHITDLLKKDNLKDVTVKIYTDIQKYTDRLDQLSELDADESHTEAIKNTLNCVSL